MADLATAYIQVIPSMQGVKGSLTEQLGGEASSAGTSTGNSFVSTLKKVIAAAGIGAVVKEALSAGGDLQQSFGGLDTIYESASDSMKTFAKEAASAGISANTYAEQAVSFGAALKQSFGDDLQGAAEAANTAILDMADNAAKMGTDVESIQNAYQGFAKQNYTMLDNLKLGYGGTKSEMERLLADATALSGVEYNIDDLGDVYEAIHVIQGELGLTGTASSEASETFTGSMSAMKAAAENFLADLSLGNDVSEDLSVLLESTSNFLFNNAIPMLTNIAGQIPELLVSVITTGIPSLLNSGSEMIHEIGVGLVTAIPELLSAGEEILTSLVGGITESLGSIGDAGIVDNIIQGITTKAIGFSTTAVELIGQLATGFINAIPQIMQIGLSVLEGFLAGLSADNGNLLNTIVAVINSIVDCFTQNLPTILSIGMEILMTVISGIVENLPSIMDAALQIIESLFNGIVDNLPAILDCGLELIMALVEGIVENLPEIVTSAIEMITSLTDTLYERLPEILQMGMEFIIQLAAGIIQNLPQIIAASAKIVSTMIGQVKELPSKLISYGKSAISGLVTGITNAIPSLLSAAKNCITQAFNAFKQTSFYSVGSNIISGIISGVTSTMSSLVNAVKQAAKKALDAAKSLLGIKSPSRVFRDVIGKNVMLGFAEGIEGNIDAVTDAVDNATSSATSEFAAMDLSSAISTDVSATVNTDNGTDRIVEAVNAMSEAIFGMKIVMDSGTLVGSIAGKMDSALASRNRMILRGGVAV